MGGVKVSIIIPTYNRENIIGKTLKNLLQQTYSDIEIIVVDDGSSDNTLDVVSGFKESRIKYIKHSENKGACAARNTGIRAAVGEYIMLNDSDDLSSTDRVEKQLNALRRFGADICFGKYRRHGFGKRYSQEFPDLEDGIQEGKLLRSRNYVSATTLMAKKSVFEEVQFDESLKMWQDYDWSVRTSIKYTYCFISDIIADVFLQNDSISLNKRETLLKTNEILLRKYKSYYDVAPEVEAFLLDNIIMNKAFLNKDCTKECNSLLKVDKSPKRVIKALLGKTGGLKAYITIRNYWIDHGITFNKI